MLLWSSQVFDAQNQCSLFLNMFLVPVVIQLNSFMNLDSEMQVRAAGGLLAVLQQKMLVGASDVEEYKMTPVQIESISELSLYPPSPILYACAAVVHQRLSDFFQMIIKTLAQNMQCLVYCFCSHFQLQSMVWDSVFLRWSSQEIWTLPENLLFLLNSWKQPKWN